MPGVRSGAMRTRLTLSLFFGFLLTASCATTPAATPSASAEPTLTHRLSGKTSSLEDLKGKVLVLNFWAEWCRPCIREIPAIQRVVAEAGDQVMFLPVWYQPESEIEKTLIKWIERQPPVFSTEVWWANAELHRLYPHPRIPLTVVLGRDGTELERFSRSIEKEPDVERLRAAIQRGLAPALTQLAPKPPLG